MLDSIKNRFKRIFKANKQKDLPLVKDNASQVEFYLIDAFEIFHFLPLYFDLLKSNIRARIVAEPNSINTSQNWFDYKEAIKILDRFDINYATQANENATLAVTTQESSLLSKYKNKKAWLSYGLGLVKNYFMCTRKVCDGFDYVLAHGSYQKSQLKQFISSDKIFIIGYPKHELLFTAPPLLALIKAKYHIATTKPILLYFPTWDEDSSIQIFAKAIKALKNDFFVITKPHHCTFRLKWKKNDLKRLYDISHIVLDGNASFEECAMLAQYALIDAKSGASTNVPYLNPHTKFLLLSPREELEKHFVEELVDIANIINNPNKLTKDTIINATYPLKHNIEYFYAKSDFSVFLSFIKHSL